MPSSHLNDPEEFELLSRTSSPAYSESTFVRKELSNTLWSRLERFRIWWPHSRPNRRWYRSLHGTRLLRRPWLLYIYRTILTAFGLIVVLIVFSTLFLPSYSHPPDNYSALAQRCLAPTANSGCGNIRNEKVFIAATLYDPQGALLGGEWGSALLGLVSLLGPDNVYLSIYENDPDPGAQKALESFKAKINCNSSVVSEHLPLEELPNVVTYNGESKTKRIAFLAEVRNRALRPLQSTKIPFEKLLFLNDVFFRPIDAANLLFSTNSDSSGVGQYDAVCAVDFINAFKFYDRFATRDLEGNTMGVPFFPYFTNAGNATSRSDVLQQKDAVRVRSCWGGMAAFKAIYFQDLTSSALDLKNPQDLSDISKAPLRFRFEPDPYWDASECCLIHADISYLRGRNGEEARIFTNPYVRVAYDSATLGWLPYVRKVERLFSPFHNLINHLAGLPESNPRRLEKPGDRVVEKVWHHGADTTSEPYHETERIAMPGRFCGYRKLQVLNERPKKGEKNWYNALVPPGG